MANLEEEKVLLLVNEQLKSGRTAIEVVESCRKGVCIVGEMYSQGTYYLSDLVMSEEIFKRVMSIVESFLPAEEKYHGLRIVMGTAEGDIHDLGKNIVVYLLRSHGFHVYDLGVNVPPEKFLEAVIKTGAKVVGISVLLTFCVGAVKKVVELIEEKGLRDQVKIVIGGYPADKTVREFTGVDDSAQDILKALEIIMKYDKQQDG